MPEYCILIASALSAQTNPDSVRELGRRLKASYLPFLKNCSNSSASSTRSREDRISAARNCSVNILRAIILCTTLVRSRQSMQFVLTTPVCCRRVCREESHMKYPCSCSWRSCSSSKAETRLYCIFLHSVWKSQCLYLHGMLGKHAKRQESRKTLQNLRICQG